MTVLDPLAAAGGPSPVRPAASQRARRRLVVAAVAVAVVSAVGAGGRWVTHPTALEPVGNGLDSRVRVRDSAVIGMFAQPTSGQVRLVSAEPVITEDSANATVRVLLCTNPTELPAGTTLGSDRGRAEQVCARTRPARDAPLGRVSPTVPYLVLEVTPRAPGTVTVEGLRVRYRAGVQRGEQDSGLVVTVVSS